MSALPRSRSLKEHALKTRDENGKYKPQGPKKQAAAVVQETVIEDGVFVSPGKKSTFYEGGEDDNCSFGFVSPNTSSCEKGKRSRNRVGLSNREPKQMMVQSFTNSHVVKIEKKLLLTSVQVTDAIVPTNRMSWDDNSSELLFTEPLLITSENSFVSELNINLPQTFTDITSVDFRNTLSDGTKAKSIVITTATPHYLDCQSQVRLLTQRGKQQQESMFEYTIHQIVDQFSFVCSPVGKGYKGKEIRVQINHSEPFPWMQPSVSTSFAPTVVYVKPPLNQTEIAEMVSARLASPTNSVVWNEDSKTYSVPKDGARYSYPVLLNREAHAFRHPYRVQIPAADYQNKGHELASIMQSCLNPPLITKNNNTLTVDGVNMEIQCEEYLPLQLARTIADLINSTLKWEDNVDKVYGDYDEKNGIYTFVRYCKPFSMAMNADLARLLGFISTSMSNEHIYSSDRPVWHARYVDSTDVYPKNRYNVTYCDTTDKLLIQSLDNGEGINYGFSILPSALQTVLQLESKDRFTTLSSVPITRLSSPNMLYVTINDMGSAEWKSLATPTEKKYCLAVLKLDTSVGEYKLLKCFDSFPQETDSLTISLYTPSGTLYQTIDQYYMCLKIVY